MVPPAKYGEVAFFWWHGDDITKNKLSWILDQLKDKHICGLQINYCHTNSGGTSYGLTMPSSPKPFSDLWWELVRWFVGECKKYEISVSLSDYTLGAPGQGWYTDWVLEKRPELTGQRLVLSSEGNIVVERVVGSLNPMAKGVGDAIVDEFYGSFERHIPNECGKGVNFFFSDELNFNISGNLWCDDFREEFFNRKGYDICEKWLAIYQDIGTETPKIRLDYYDVIVQLSEERYFKVVYDWHQERGMTFGCDHGGRGKWITEFGDYFRTMKWNQGPGNDQPFLESDIIKSKCSASIAHMYKRPRVWLEGFHSSGWDTGTNELADAIFRNFALGHNLLSLHGLYYSTHGSMWEWAPPCNHHHMPYWCLMGKLLECTKRLSYLIAQGVHRCDVAIVYPVAAVEADELQGKQAVITAFETAAALYHNGIDFDFIDFESIERADIVGGQLCVSGEAFYTIIVPEMAAVRYGMMRKLRTFATAGGQVIFQKCLPNASDRIGCDDERLNKLVYDILNCGCIVNTSDEIVEKMAEHHVFDFTCDAKDVYFLHRYIKGKEYYLIYRAPEASHICLRTSGYPVILNPWDGSKMRFEAFESVMEHGVTMTKFRMPLTESELLIISFETERDVWEQLPAFVPYTEQDRLIEMDGEWSAQLIPTMDNKYGDWRLPAFDGFVGAEARELEYRYCDDDGDASQNSTWQKSVYSYGTFFYTADGSADEDALIAAEYPVDEMSPYRFSWKYGVEGDAGAQGSYHGLKGKLSDEFLVMGTKRVTYVNSDSVYEGEGPYYFFTTVSVDQPVTVWIETGSFKPDKIWIDHEEVCDERITLSNGRHYILLRFPCGGRSYFVLRKDIGFVQTWPLVTNWFGNTDIIPFDAMPGVEGRFCQYQFNCPVGAKRMKVRSVLPVKAYVDGKELKKVNENEFEINAIHSTKIMLIAKQCSGVYDTAIFTDPITFETGVGMYNMNLSPAEQGLGFYSGGISLKKHITVKKDDRRVFFAVNPELGCAFEVYINQEKVSTLFTYPYRCEITNFLRDGSNDVEVRAFNTLYNHMKTIPTYYNKPHKCNKK